MDPRLYRHVCPGRVVNVQRSNGEQQGEASGRRGLCRGVGRRRSQLLPTFLLSGLIHKATVKAVDAQQRSVSVEWCEAGVVKGKEVRAGAPAGVVRGFAARGAALGPASPGGCWARPACRASCTPRCAAPRALLLSWLRSVPAAVKALLFLHESPSGVERLKREGRDPRRCPGRCGMLRIVMGRAGSVRAGGL